MDKRTQTLPTRSGFTLVELLIVIIVLALLTVVSGTSYTATMKTARDGRRKIDLESIRSALEVYHSDHSTYPDTTGGSPLSGFLETGSKKYISMPKDPKTKTDYFYSPTSCEPIGAVTVCNSYILAVALENDPGNAADECTSLREPPDNMVFACKDTAGAAAMCNYCVDPYGQLTPTPFAPGPPPG